MRRPRSRGLASEDRSTQDAAAMDGGPRATGVWAAIGHCIDAAHRAGDDGTDGELPGIWGRIAVLTDPGEFRPKLADDIELKVFHQRWGGDYGMVANPRDMIYHQLDETEIDLVRLMDGTRPLRELVLDRLQDSGELDLSGPAELVQTLYSANFLDRSYVDAAAAVARAVHPVSPGRERLKKFAKTQMIDWKGGDRVARAAYRYGLRFLFTPVGVAVALVVEVLGFLAFLDLVNSGRYTMIPDDALLAFVVITTLNYLVIVGHEAGHALTLIHYGRRVKSAGFMIYFGSPALYVESADALMLDRGKRIMQSLNGPFAESLMAALFALILFAFPDVGIRNILYRFVVLNYLFLFFNLIPLLELDGYWVLADALQVPELRPMSLAFVRTEMWRKIRRREAFTRREVGLALYGIVGIAFTIFMIYLGLEYWGQIFGGVIRQLWGGNLVSRIVLLLLLLLVAGPLIRGAIALVRAIVRRARAVWRSLRFRLQTKWRVEAAMMIDALPLFDDVPEDVLSDLAGRVRLRSIANGQAVVRQAERASAFYVVRKGTLRVIEEDPDSGAERTLRVLGRGDGFGELGLADAAPRTATVRAVAESQVFEIDKGTFEQLLADMVHVPDFAPTIEKLIELRELEVFSRLEADELKEVLERGAWLNVPPGEVIIEQGDIGDAFYAIRSGRVEVYEEGVRTRTMGPNSAFGEIALLFDVPRTASVVAVTPVRCFRLDREGFDRLIAQAYRSGAVPTAIAPDRVQEH
jgi:CRP-like cAMP-binding protein/Zn-dependent protease